MMVGLLLLASSCQSDPSILEQALDPGTAVPIEEPSPAPLDTPSATPSALPSATAASIPTILVLESTNTPEPVSPTETPIPLAPTDPLEGTVHVIYPIVEPLSGVAPLEGEPFATAGDMPEAIIASTEQCDVVSIDIRSGISTTLWEYSKYKETFLDCTDQGFEYPEYPGTEEIPPGFIRDVEWVQPNSVLLSMCCDPSGEGFELLDIEKQEKRYWLPQLIWYASIDNQRMLLVSGSLLRGVFMSLRTGPVVLDEIVSDRRIWTYEPFEDFPYHHLDFDHSGVSSDKWVFGRTVVGRSTWVGGDDVVVVVWTFVSDLGWYPWLAKINLDESETVSNARGLGWMLPTGDQRGNLVVAEQFCSKSQLAACIGSPAKVVVVDPQTLVPLYEVEVDDPIADMDMERGWLLVTLVDGRMGILDLADGTFAVLAEGIRNAVWQE